MKTEQIQAFCEQVWENSIIPELVEYIRIPNKSPMFDASWKENGYMEKAVEQFVAWSKALQLEGMKLEVVRLPGRTPLIFMEIAGHSDSTVLLYGHLDKQPEMTGWRKDLAPWKPVLEEDKLYGRGGADDGYAMFSS
ncbi:MAG: M20/M25/M40 family metallo-hydrolase, partial [Gammaproteobacteria bacterium]